MTLTLAQRDALTQALHGARADVAARVVEYATTTWNTLGDWRDDDIARFVAAVTPRIEAGKLTIAQLTDAYIAAVIEDEPVGVADLSQIRGGVPNDTVYRRPAVAMRSALAEGASVSDAIEQGAKRLESLVKTDLQLAHTHQARATMTGRTGRRDRRGRRRRGGGRVEAFRRVPSGQENCALCLIASTQRYWVKDLLPIHPGCDCGVEPLGLGEHTAQVIDRDLLERVHAQVAGLTGAADRAGSGYEHMIITRDHGEYGPTIGWRRQKFTGKDDLKREAIEIVEPKPEAKPPAEPELEGGWFWDAIKNDDLRECDLTDLEDMLQTAREEKDARAVHELEKALDRLHAQIGKYRGTGFTRAQLREQWNDYIEEQYWQAELETNGFFLNAAGRAAGISSRSLFKGSEVRAYKYASDELKYYWQEHPRLTFDAFVGDADALSGIGKAAF